MKSDLALPMSAQKLIPHSGPLCMVDRLIEFEEQSGTVEVFVSSENVLVGTENQLDTLGLAEMMAQSYAAVKGYADLLSGKPIKQGFLVGIRKMEFCGKVFAGDHLQIRVETLGAISGFAVAEARVTRNKEELAAGKVKLWVPEQPGSGAASE